MASATFPGRARFCRAASAGAIRLLTLGKAFQRALRQVDAADRRARFTGADVAETGRGMQAAAIEIVEQECGFEGRGRHVRAGRFRQRHDPLAVRTIETRRAEATHEHRFISGLHPRRQIEADRGHVAFHARRLRHAVWLAFDAHIGPLQFPVLKGRGGDRVDAIEREYVAPENSV